MIVTHEGDCCIDCLAYLANGDCPEQAEKIHRVWPEGGLVAACEGWFSWSPCEACGDTLEGDRHRFAVLDEGETHD